MASAFTEIGELSVPAAVAAAADDGAVTRNWLLCRAGSHRLALPMPAVIEIMRMLPIEEIAGAPPLVVGLCVIRGAPVAVIDTARLFGDEGARYQRLVTVRTGDRVVAFAANEVLGVEAIAAQAVEDLPPLLRSGDIIAAIATRDEDLVFFLQAARAVPDDFVPHANLARTVS
jgi:purine-binding chemotaxis protein CheW